MPVRIGTAGSPLGSTLDGIKYLKDAGLDAMEVEFTYGVRMKNDLAERIGLMQEKTGIALSVHAPYYINLASLDKSKVIASKKRILDSCEKAHLMNASPVVFHPGFYQDRDPNSVYDLIRDQITDLKESIEKKGWNVSLAPETTGKASQFGDIVELIKLSEETGCRICIDFSHIYARNLGKIDYGLVFKLLKGFKHIHSHFSGIEFTSKGERRHILTDRAFFEPLARQILDRKANITLINESPNPLDDALMMKKCLEELES